MTVGGAARHNVANALAAAGRGRGPAAFRRTSIGRALRRFGRARRRQRGPGQHGRAGRCTARHRLRPQSAWDGRAGASMMAALPARRRLVLIGQAGDRSDEAIRALARAALGLRPDRVVLKEMERYLRGRRPGEIPALMADELIRLGVAPEAVSRPGGEVAAVRDALAWARPGDVLLLTVHQDRPAGDGAARAAPGGGVAGGGGGARVTGRAGESRQRTPSVTPETQAPRTGLIRRHGYLHGRPVPHHPRTRRVAQADGPPSPPTPLDLPGPERRAARGDSGAGGPPHARAGRQPPAEGPLAAGGGRRRARCRWSTCRRHRP